MNEYLELYLDVMQVWYIVLAILGFIGLFMAGMFASLEDEPHIFARALLITAGLAVAAPLWPISVPLILAGVMKWSWKNSELEWDKPLPRKERKRIQRELDLARADKILDDILREEDLKQHVGRELRA